MMLVTLLNYFSSLKTTMSQNNQSNIQLEVPSQNELITAYQKLERIKGQTRNRQKKFVNKRKDRMEELEEEVAFLRLQVQSQQQLVLYPPEPSLGRAKSLEPQNNQSEQRENLIKQLQNENASLRTQLPELSLGRARSPEQSSSLQGQLIERNSTINQLQQQNNVKDQTIFQVESQNSQLRQQVTELTTSNNNKDQTISQLENRLRGCVTEDVDRRLQDLSTFLNNKIQ